MRIERNSAGSRWAQLAQRRCVFFFATYQKLDLCAGCAPASAVYDTAASLPMLAESEVARSTRFGFCVFVVCCLVVGVCFVCFFFGFLFVFFFFCGIIRIKNIDIQFAFDYS